MGFRKASWISHALQLAHCSVLQRVRHEQKLPGVPSPELNQSTNTEVKVDLLQERAGHPKAIWHEGWFDQEPDASADRGSCERNPQAVGPASESPSGPVRGQLVAFTRLENVLDMRNEAISKIGTKEILDQFSAGKRQKRRKNETRKL